MTFPSTGCQTCKSRRVKCDETQPECKRCVKSQRTCHGLQAPGQIGSEVHIENCYASGQRKRPRGPRSTRDITLSKRLRILSDLQTQAVVYYLHSHLQTLQDTPTISRGVTDDVLPVWKASSTGAEECPILDLALSCISLAVFSNTQHCPPAAIEASLKYAQLLQMTQTTILSLNRSNMDACLLATFFMSRYEQVFVQRVSLKPAFITGLQSFSHHDGALAILKMWREGHFSPVKSDVVKHTRRAMLRSALLRTLQLPDWILDGSSFGETELDLAYDRILTRIIHLRYRLSELFKRAASTSIAEDLGQEAREIDAAIKDWRSHFPKIWSYEEHTLPESLTLTFPTRDFCSARMFSYATPAYATVWNKYYATLLLLTSTQLRIYELAKNDNHSRLQQLSKIEDLANNLASSIPFSLSRFQICPGSRELILTTNEEIKPYMASLVAWPLSIASSLAVVPQKNWFAAVLARVGRIIGDRVLECADTDQWLEL